MTLSCVRKQPAHKCTRSVLIFGATDTTSSALSRILYLLAKHPDVQDRLRQEIRAAKETYGVLTYDELESLPLLDAILRETLRLFVCAFLFVSSHADICTIRYPPASQLLRKYAFGFNIG